MPTMADVALAAGVSPMTVSRAFKGQAAIRTETRDRILQIAERIGYFPNLAASELASSHSRSVGIVLPTLQDSIYVTVLEGASEVLRMAGYDHVLQAIAYCREREAAVLRALLARRVRAILLPSIGHDAKARSIIRRLPVPHVEFGSRSDDNLGPAVGHSDRMAAFDATRLLIARGRSRIALICGPKDQTSHARDRRQGYLEALKQAGLARDPALIREIDHAVVPAIQAFRQLCQLRPAIDGLVVGGEIWEAAVMLEAVKLDIQVPGQLSIVGIGDFELAAHLPVPMTVIALPRRDTGRVAAKMLITLCEGGELDQLQVTLATQLIDRGSA